jgi:hypothetical protein
MNPNNRYCVYNSLLLVVKLYKSNPYSSTQNLSRSILILSHVVAVIIDGFWINIHNKMLVS